MIRVRANVHVGDLAPGDLADVPEEEEWEARITAGLLTRLGSRPAPALVDPEESAALARYQAALDAGLSDAEAREEGWPAESPQGGADTEGAPSAPADAESGSPGGDGPDHGNPR